MQPQSTKKRPLQRPPLSRVKSRFNSWQTKLKELDCKGVRWTIIGHLTPKTYNNLEKYLNENALIPVLENAVVVFNDDDFDSVSKASEFLPRIQLIGTNSSLSQENQVAAGNYALIRATDDFVDLGPNVDVVVMAWRPKALCVGDGEVTAVYDRNDPEFTRITEASEVQDSGCMFGPEFLIYIPELDVFATYYMQSKTARRAARQVKTRMHKGATLKSHLIKAKKYRWYGPQVIPCTTIPDLPQDFETTANSVIVDFQNPKVSDVETVVEEDRTR